MFSGLSNDVSVFKYRRDGKEVAVDFIMKRFMYLMVTPLWILFKLQACSRLRRNMGWTASHSCRTSLSSVVQCFDTWRTSLRSSLNGAIISH